MLPKSGTTRSVDWSAGCRLAVAAGDAGAFAASVRLAALAMLLRRRWPPLDDPADPRRDDLLRVPEVDLLGEGTDWV